MVMVSANDPVESFFNSLQIVKDSFLPLECGIRKAAKDFEHCWPGSNSGTRNLELVSVEKISSKVQICFSKKKCTQCVVSHDRGFLIKIPIKNFLGFFSQNCTSNGYEVNMSKKGLNERYAGNEDGTRMNCIRFVVMWSVLLDGFVQAVPSLFKTSKKHLQETAYGNEVCTNSSSHASKRRATCELKQKQSRGLVSTFQNEFLRRKEGMNMSIECFTGFVSDQLTQNLQKFELGVQQSECKNCDSSLPPHPTNQFNRAVTSILEGKKEDINGFLRNLRFARVRGIPSSIVGVASSVKEEGDDSVASQDTEESGGSSPQKLANGLFSLPLSNVERLRSTLLTVSLTELIELVPQFGRSSKDYPDKKKLFSVQDFFRYTESAGRRFFEELDRDGDGQVTLEDLEVAMRKRKLPRRYAHEFMCCARSHLFSKSFGWKQFLSLMEQKEPTILRAYTTLCLSKSGTLQKSEILASLKNAGLPANEDNAVAMMRFLNADTEESISYGHFRNFMLLLPSDRLEKDPRSIWFKAATVVAVAPPVEIPAGSVLKSALAGGISCALSTTLMHPIDTIKTQVQALTLTFPEIISKLPEIGVRGLYRGSIPAILGQFSSHSLRTGICEASKLVLINVAPTLPDIQVQSVASFCSTFLGTAARIPCEVLKQRLQAGIFDNVGDAIVGTWHQDGLKGFFRGTGVTLCREIPFYVAGTGLYAESKKVVQRLLRRDLEPWETIAVGALSGGLTAVLTTPFDVVKTRMMTATPGGSVSVPIVAFSILQHEGPLGLFRGAVPRFFWVAPLGAMNFAGYELLRKAMDKNEE